MRVRSHPPEFGMTSLPKPSSPAGAPRPDAPTMASPAQQPARVLIVDDNAAIRRMLAASLGDHYDICTAETGERGVELARARNPDLVVLDVGLPGMDGYAVLRTLRGHPRTEDAAVLIVTGGDDRNRNLALLREGAQDLLLKPFCLEELQVRVRNLIAAKLTRDTLNAAVGRHETDLVRLAQQVANQQQQLQTTIEELRRARAIAEQATLTQSNFLRIMSHELRTPVAALQLHMRLIERSAEEGRSDELRDGIARMERSSRRLLHLVSTFLEWSRAQRQGARLALDDVSLEGIAREVCAEMQAYASQKGLDLAVSADGLPTLRTDPRIVRLLLVHLVHRAVQVSRSGTVLLQVNRTEGAQCVSVQDTALPLSSEEQRDVLDLIEDCGDITSRAGAGSGLGLRVVCDIAGSVGGELSARPVDGVGNAWTLSLPPVDATTGSRPVLPKGRPGEAQDAAAAGADASSSRTASGSKP